MTYLRTMAETSLYDDHSYSGSMSGESSSSLNSPTESDGPRQTPSATATLKRPTAISLNSTTANSGAAGANSIKELKKNLTLDFSSPESAKKTLATPDIVRFLQLASPELEKFLTQSVVQVTTTGGTPTPTNFLFPKTVTSEQEQYARGFIDALNHIHQSNNFSPGATLLSPAGLAATLDANIAALQASRSAAASSNKSNSTNNTAPQDSAVTSSTSSASGTNLTLKSTKAQSPLNPGGAGTLPSVIMSTVGFPVSMSGFSNFTNNYNNTMNTLLNGGLHSGTSMGSIPAAMAFFNLQTNASTNQKAAAALLQEEETRPPSQSAESGSMEFTNLTQAQAVTRPVSAQVSGDTFQLQANQYLNSAGGSSSASSHPPPTKVPRLAPHSSSAIVKQEQDQAVPNVNIQVEESFGIPGCSSSTLPLDLKEQEALKLERKRHRNRIAATKCRKRKLEKIADLEAEVKLQEELKKDLIEDSLVLKGDVSRLRAELEVHRNSGCPVSKSLNGIGK